MNQDFPNDFVCEKMKVRGFLDFENGGKLVKCKNHLYVNGSVGLGGNW